LEQSLHRAGSVSASTVEVKPPLASRPGIVADAALQSGRSGTAVRTDPDCGNWPQGSTNFGREWDDRTVTKQTRGSEKKSDVATRPHVVVLFGATGDLARRKLIPG